MSYQVIPNVIFLLSVLGIVLMILRHLPKAASLEEQKPDLTPVEQKLAIKGLPVVAVFWLKSFTKWWVKKIWNFILEAKDLRPSALNGYKIKKIFGHLPALSSFQLLAKPEVMPARENEEELLKKIKNEPKNMSHYNRLGRFYIDKENFADAKDIFLYLIGHEPGNSDFRARLAYSCYKLGEFSTASEHYQKSLALDSTHPNRYYNLGQSLKAQGEIQAAREAFSKALELEPYNLKYEAALKNAETNPPNLA